MRKVVILTLIIALALVGTAWAATAPPATGPRITYGGYLDIYDQSGMVNADTLICVFNPNMVPITAAISVLDKNGIRITYDDLHDHTGPLTQIPARGWGWRTLGQLVTYDQQELQAPYKKYTWFVYWTKPAYIEHYRGMVIEVKEIIYTEPTAPESCWIPQMIRSWSEAALGGVGVNTAMPSWPQICYGGYVGYSIQGGGLVDADTLICVFNPNNKPIGGALNPVLITVFDKDGNFVAESQLHNSIGLTPTIKAKGWVWQTLGKLVATAPHEIGVGTKYTYFISWKKPTFLPNRGLVVEVKEILYMTAVDPEYCWNPTVIRDWSEVALGNKGVTN